MVNRKLSVVVIAGLLLSVGVFAQKKDDKKQTDDQKKEIQAVVKIADDLGAGQTAPNDLGLAWGHADFMKAQGNKQYAPFTVTLDPSKITAGVVAFYWRVVSKDAPPPPPAVDPKDAKKDDKKNPPKRPEFAYEDISFSAGHGSCTPIPHQPVDHAPRRRHDVYAPKEPTRPRIKPAAKPPASNSPHGAGS